MSEGLTYLRGLLSKRPGDTVLSSVYGAAYLYLFKGKSEVLDSLMQQHAQQPAEWRLRKFQKLIRYDGLLLKDNKALAYENVVGVTRTTRDNTPQSRRVIVQALGYTPLRSRLEDYAKQGFRPLTNKAYDSAIMVTLQSADLSSYMGKFVARKMAFITGSGSIPPAEVISDLKEAATYALLRAYPAWVDRGHLLAIAKTAVHNRGINFIKEHTTQSRMHLQQSSNGTYSAVNLSLSQFVDAAQAGDATGMARGEGDHLITLLDGSRASDHNFPPDLLKSIRQLVVSRKLSLKQREYLKLLIGFDDELFTAYLGQSNSDLAHRASFEAYHKQVCEFLDIEEARAASFLASLRQYL